MMFCECLFFSGWLCSRVLFKHAVCLCSSVLQRERERAYIKNDWTGLLFSHANPPGFEVLSEMPCFDIDLGKDLNHG